MGSTVGGPPVYELEGSPMRRSTATPVIAAIAVLALLAPGCGDDDGDDEQEVREVVEEVFTSNDPEICGRLTQNLLDQTSSQQGEEALADCEEQVQEGEPPDSVEVGNVSAEGDEASATFSISGGDLEGGAGEVTLVREGDQWKVDAIALGGPGAD
jgi:hypothetical protein